MFGKKIPQINERRSVSVMPEKCSWKVKKMLQFYTKMIHIEGEGPRSTTARVCFFTQIESDCMWGGRGILTKPLCMEESRNWMELRTTGLAALVEEKKKGRQKLQEWEHESLDPLVSGSILSLRFDRRIDYCLLTLTAFVVNICFVSLTRQGVECFHCGHLSKIHFNQKTKKTKEHGEKCSYNKTWMKEYSSGHGTTVQTTSTVCLQSRKASQGKVKGLNSLL